MKTCLIIIDVQRGFLTEDTIHIPSMIQHMVSSMKFDHIVSTRFINTDKTPHYIYTGWHDLMDAESQQLDNYIESISERVFDKGTNSCLTTELRGYLIENHIDKLYFVGVNTDCCVLASAFDAFDSGFNFEILTQCCASTMGKHVHEIACEVCKCNFGCTMVNESAINYERLFTEFAAQRGFTSRSDVVTYRDEIADLYFGNPKVTDPWERACMYVYSGF